MDRLPWIALTGLARAGKDTVAERLRAEHGFVRVAFADPLKDLALSLDPWMEGHVRLTTLVESRGWEGAKEVPEVRRTLQALGVGVRFHLGEDTWVAAAEREASTHRSPVVFSDCRFPNEARMVQRQGGLVVRVTRTALPALAADAAAHISETAMASWTPDAVLRNEGTVTDLHHQVDRLVETIRLGEDL